MLKFLINLSRNDIAILSSAIWLLTFACMNAPSIIEIMITAISVGSVSSFISFLAIPRLIWFSIDVFQNTSAFCVRSFSLGCVSSTSVAVFKIGHPARRNEYLK